MITAGTFWAVTILLGLGTFLIRYSFLGLVSPDRLSPRVQIYLRYVGVAVLPAMVVPMVLWPAAADGATDWARLGAAMLAFLAARRFGPALAIVAGMGGLWLAGAIFG
jgi:branched-subunit amino acid transport protein